VNLIVYRLQTKAQQTAKAIVAAVVPILAAAGFAVLDELAVTDLPTTWRIVVTVVASSLAVYRTPNREQG
jgi:lysylphosphatidylglycerol synthetase-like protein (DUF2156 family)